MRRTRWKLFALFVFLIWEGWWAYVYFNATIPDVKYDMVVALIMGVGVPVWLAVVAGGTFWMVRWVKRSTTRE
jgi:hypothetical protein